MSLAHLLVILALVKISSHFYELRFSAQRLAVGEPAEEGPRYHCQVFLQGKAHPDSVSDADGTDFLGILINANAVTLMTSLVTPVSSSRSSVVR